jgi:hypothetical protein
VPGHAHLDSYEPTGLDFRLTAKRVVLQSCQASTLCSPAASEQHAVPPHVHVSHQNTRACRSPQGAFTDVFGPVLSDRHPRRRSRTQGYFHHTLGLIRQTRREQREGVVTTEAT